MERYQYYAFISYSRKDEQWAQWLQGKLENYRLPNIAAHHSQLPKHIRPVFLDKTDIGIGGLHQSLARELEDSRYLIVICSPHAAASEWVNREVEHFISMDRKDRIIPFIVEGSPSPSGADQPQCYPPSLDRTILGASLTELPKEQAFIKVVASMLGLKFDELWQRHKRREQRKKRIRYSIAGLLCALLLASGVWLWDYNRVKTRYYIDYVERWGLPEGLFERDASQVKKLAVHYAFRYQRRKLRSVTYANSVGKPEHPSSVGGSAQRPSMQRFLYNESGRLQRVNYLDKNGKILIAHNYSGDQLQEVDLKDMQGNDAVLKSSISGAGSALFTWDYQAAKSKINHYSLTRNEKGEIIKIRFKYGGLEYINDINGISGSSYTLDSLGRITGESFLDIDGEPGVNRLGIASRNLIYDNDGHLR